MPKEVEILGKQYKVGKLSAFQQMYILKRAAPVLGALQSAFSGVDAEAEGTDVLGPLGEVVGALPDESLEYVVNTCLDVADVRQAGGGWAPMRKNGALMFPDIDLLTLLSLTAHVLSENLAGFFNALPSIQRGGAKKA